MAVTLEELKEKLAMRFDEVSLMELLDISSEDLVERFSDIVEDRYDKLITELEEGEE